METEETKTKKPRIAVIGLKGLPAYGGSARAGENMLAELKERYDFVVFNTASHTDRKSGVHDGIRQVVFRRFPIRGLNTLYYYLRAMLHCLLGKRHDLIHVFHLDAAFIVPLLRLRFPVIAGHRARPQEFSKWGPVARTYFNLMELVFYKLPAEVITSVSPAIVSRYQSWTTREIVYIPNGVVLAEPAPVEIPHQDHLLFASGRIMETKGAHVLLEALSDTKYADKIVVMGNLAHDREYAERLRGMAAGLDVDFLGLVKEKRIVMEYARQARLIVYPSFHEGMSNMLLEAGSTGRPLVVSDIPENRAIFEEDETVFFRCGDAKHLAERIRWVLEHPAVALEIAGKGRDKIRAHFDWKSIAAEYDALYRWLCAERRPLRLDETAHAPGRPVRSFGRSLPGCDSDAC